MSICTHTHMYIFLFFLRVHPQKKRMPGQRKGQDRSIVKRRMKADLYCAREVNKAERIVTAASRYIVIYLNIIFPQRIEGIIVFAHITPYYQSSLVDVLTRDLLFFTYPWFSTCRKPGFIYFFFFLPRLSTSSNEIDFFVTFVTLYPHFFFRWFNRLDILNERSKIIRDVIILCLFRLLDD